MGKIQKLSAQVANQIAAGEVVERPSSVVKELVENALDAGATRIEVSIREGGLSHIVVEDNGAGMDDDDMRLAVKRYATSKLLLVSDLNNLHTFGFRGEALPSIASVSQMTIISRPAGVEHGNKAIIRAGKIEELIKTAFAPGTRVEVRDLFFNVPARLKFIKSKRVEALEIDRLLRAFAFSHRFLGIRFFIDDKLAFSCNQDSEPQLLRAELLLGAAYRGFLYETEGIHDNLSLSGVIGAPMVQRRDTRGIMFFINDRLITDKKLVVAVKMAFQSLIESGFNPVALLRMGIPRDEVDINVHPRKAEVRFQDERQVVSSIIGWLSQFLAKTPWLKKTPDTLTISPVKSIYENQGPRPFDYLLTPSRAFVPEDRKLVPDHNDNKLLSATSFSGLRALGQVGGCYLVLEGEDGLVIIDQHAAHERVLYERLKSKKTLLTASPMLFPLSFDVDLATMSLFLERESELRSLGIEAEKFGDKSIVIRALPDFMKSVDGRALLESILSDLSTMGRSITTEDMCHRLFATLACHASIRAGQKLELEEIHALLQQLDGIEFGAHCPHGRPLVKSISKHEMKKWFNRP